MFQISNGIKSQLNMEILPVCDPECTVSFSTIISTVGHAIMVSTLITVTCKKYHVSLMKKRLYKISDSSCSERKMLQWYILCVNSSKSFSVLRNTFISLWCAKSGASEGNIVKFFTSRNFLFFWEHIINRQVVFSLRHDLGIKNTTYRLIAKYIRLNSSVYTEEV